MANTKKAKVVNTEVTEVKGDSKNKTLIIVSAIILGLLLIGLYVKHIKNVNLEKSYQTSYLLDSKTTNLEIKNLDEVKQILTEIPSEFYVLITYTGNKDTHNLETGLKKIIDEKSLSDSFYYLDIKDIMDKDDYIARVNNAFNTDLIKKVPVILYYKDGKIVDTVTRDDNNCINAADFQKLLDIYDEGR